jgi:hypothetical protein
MLPRRFLVPLLLLSALGCGKPLAYNATVTGTVKLDGVPLPNVRVEFIPRLDPDRKAPNSSGFTNDKGEFKLTCDNQKPGAVIAPHRVIVMQGRTGDDEKDASRTFTVPQVYTIAAQTPLLLEVTADKTTYDLILKRDP